VLRTDVLASNMTAAKAARIAALFAAWTRGVKALGHEQWRLFFETGRFDKNHDVDKTTFKALFGNAARVQMGRHAVVGQLQSWLSNRVNDFRSVVSSYEGHASAPGGMLDPGVRHMLHVINLRKAWFSRDPIVMPTSATTVLGGTLEDIVEDVCEDITEGKVVGTRVVGQRTVGGTPTAGMTIPDDVRKLARTIMRAVMAKHRRPNLARIPMVLDVRGGALLPPKRATQQGKVGYWVRLSTMEPGQTIHVPLLTHPFHQARPGTRTKGVSIQRGREGGLRFGVVTDTGAVCAQSRQAYAEVTAALKASGRHPDAPGYAVGPGYAKGHVSLYEEAIALDFGLTTLFGTSEGQLLGLEWGKRLRAYDARIQKILKGVQRRGGKPRGNTRYKGAVQDLRGWITTEINRVLNRLVAQRKPIELVVEKLDFRSPTLSRRMNRLVSTCGRAVLKAKLQDLRDRLGIKATEVNPAYSSQTCSRPGCGYVDTRNRATQGTFRCLWCGHTCHADLNAAANLSQRRALADGGLTVGKAATLAGCVRAFRERKIHAVKAWPSQDGPAPHRTARTRHRGVPDDPRLTNPYFSDKGKTGKAIQSSEVGKTQAGFAQVVLSQ
jgi:putative transposase